MVDLIPPSETILDILKETGAFRTGHFIFPNGTHTQYYFQMPLAFRYADTAKILSVGLSRMFRVDREISSKIPNITVVSPSPGGIPVALTVREALTAKQNLWAEVENGERRFRQFINLGDIPPCIIVDDIIRTGTAIVETINLLKEHNAEIIGCGSIVKFDDAPDEIEGLPVKYLAKFDCNFYETWEEACAREHCDPEMEAETVRF
jgi:orotate phosphoribosyltransferase